MRFRYAIGQSDFLGLRRDGAHFVDKSSLIEGVVDSPAQCLLFPRPRRFGKTLNLSMLRYFFELTDESREDLYSDLRVWRNAVAREHFGAHPVIYLTFKDVKYSNWDDAKVAISGVIRREFLRHFEGPIKDVGGLLGEEFDRLKAERDPTKFDDVLRVLSEGLTRATGKKVVVLIDEYDTPIHAGHLGGFHDEVVEFFRNFLSGGLKDNPCLYRGVLTGILRIAKESIFSGLNNLVVHSILSESFATDFGFTTSEVETLVDGADSADELDTIAKWYDGYRFGGRTIYNPWSVLNYLSWTDAPKPYWIDSSSNDLVRDLVVDSGLGLEQELQRLLGGESIVKSIDEHVVLRDLERTPDVVWSLLLFSGYLRADAVEDPLIPRVRLSIPNLEVMLYFERQFRTWLGTSLGRGDDGVAMLTTAFVDGDTDIITHGLGDVFANAMSYHDVARRRPESVYQAFIVGLLVHFRPDYLVTSNRESGYGRYDVLIRPSQPGRPGTILELKVTDAVTDSVDDALDHALAQIRERDYATELRAAGADPIHEIAVVFDGKRVWTRKADG